MVHQSINYPVRQRVLLVDQNSQENRVGAAVLHLSEFQHARAGMEIRHRISRYHRGHDDGLSQGACAALRKFGRKNYIRPIKDNPESDRVSANPEAD